MSERTCERSSPCCMLTTARPVLDVAATTLILDNEKMVLRQHLTLESLPLPLINPDPLPPPNDIAHNSRAQAILGNFAHLVCFNSLFQGDQLIVIPMWSMPHQWLRPSIMTTLDILQVLEATLGHVRTTTLLRIGSGIHRFHVIRRDGCRACWNAVEQAVEDDGGDGQIDVFAEQDVLLSALHAFPGEVGEAVFGLVGADLSVVQLHGGARRAAFRAGEVDGWVGEVFEGGAFGEDFGFVPFAVGEEFAEGVFDKGWGTHDGRIYGRIVVDLSVTEDAAGTMTVFELLVRTRVDSGTLSWVWMWSKGRSHFGLEEIGR